MPNAPSAITRIRLERFTAFESLALSPSPGVNAFLGANGTGSTHLMKVAYAACAARNSGTRFPDKLTRLFLPSNRSLGRLVKRRRGRSKANAEVACGVAITFELHFPTWSGHRIPPKYRRGVDWIDTDRPSTSPSRKRWQMRPGFRSLYAARNIHFEEIYSDILDRAFLPPLLGAPDWPRRQLLDTLRNGPGREGMVRRGGVLSREQAGKTGVHLTGRGASQAGSAMVVDPKWHALPKGPYYSGPSPRPI